MPFTLDQIVPWGRSFDEYVRMFSLTVVDLEKTILGCGDGPASFNATMRGLGKKMVSIDPLYRFSPEQIRGRIGEAYRTIIEQLLANQGAYVWRDFRSPQDLGRFRMEEMDSFLADFEQGKIEGRYLPRELPKLPFADGAFDLAVCSHLLFTYSAQLSCEFHCQAISEMCRVAKEARVFPVLDHGGQVSPHLSVVCDHLRRRSYTVDIETVNYEFQRGGNQMLRARQSVAIQGRAME